MSAASVKLVFLAEAADLRFETMQYVMIKEAEDIDQLMRSLLYTPVEEAETGYDPAYMGLFPETRGYLEAFFSVSDEEAAYESIYVMFEKSVDGKPMMGISLKRTKNGYKQALEEDPRAGDTLSKTYAFTGRSPDNSIFSAENISKIVEKYKKGE